jgi:MFS family permease
MATSSPDPAVASAGARSASLACTGMATTERGLQRSELRTLAILGVPTFALALGIRTVSTYVPVLAQEFATSSIVIGLLIGGEGATGSLSHPDLVDDRIAGRAQSSQAIFRGLGTSLGPLQAGVAIEVAGHDYRWTWFVCAPAILISIPFLGPLRDADLQEA